MKVLVGITGAFLMVCLMITGSILPAMSEKKGDFLIKAKMF